MELIQDIAIIFTSAGLLGVITSFLHLPIVIAYLATGLIIGPFGFNLIPIDSSTFDGLTTLGIAFMLFLVGLELDIKKIKSLGFPLLAVSFAQMIITSGLGFMLATGLGFNAISSWYIAISLVFSSTVIVVKLLSDSNQLTSLHGRLVVGILLIQDFIAIFTLIAFQGLANAVVDFNQIFKFLSALAIFSVVAYLIRKYLITYLFNLFSKTTELLFVASIAWALALAVLADKIGISPAIGAFIAGITLAPLIYSDEIRGRVRWLRDFFIVIFLSLIGAGLAGATTVNSVLITLLLSLFVILMKPLIIFAIMGLSGFRRRTTFLTGVYNTQLSEFSLILVMLGISLDQISSEVGTIIVFTMIITISISTILIENVNKIYHRIYNLLKVFERVGHFRDDFQKLPKKLENHVVLFGAHRIGMPVLDKLSKIGAEMVVVDFDPFIIKKLRANNIPSIYGDMGDPELVDELNLTKSKMVISTSHDPLDTLAILKKIQYSKSKAYVFVTGTTAGEALDFYNHGANYVVLPQYISGDFLAELLDNINEQAPITTKNHFESIRLKHIKELEKK